MPRLYHPDLGVEADVPDDEGCVAVHLDGGWKYAPEPEAREGYEPEPVTYAPVTADTSKSKRRTKTDTADTGESDT